MLLKLTASLTRKGIITSLSIFCHYGLENIHGYKVESIDLLQVDHAGSTQFYYLVNLLNTLIY